MSVNITGNLNPNVANATGTLGTLHGGTGHTTWTVNTVICAGTTISGTLQNVASVGTTGFVLTSNGAGVLPSFQAASGGTPTFTGARTYQTTSAVFPATSYFKWDTIDYNVGVTTSSASGFTTITLNTTGYYILTVQCTATLNTPAIPSNGANGWFTLYTDPAGAQNQIAFFGDGAAQVVGGGTWTATGTYQGLFTSGTVLGIQNNAIGTSTLDQLLGLNGNFQRSWMAIHLMGI